MVGRRGSAVCPSVELAIEDSTVLVRCVLRSQMGTEIWPTEPAKLTSLPKQDPCEGLRLTRDEAMSGTCSGKRSRGRRTNDGGRAWCGGSGDELCNVEQLSPHAVGARGTDEWRRPPRLACRVSAPRPSFGERRGRQNNGGNWPRSTSRRCTARSVAPVSQYVRTLWNKQNGYCLKLFKMTVNRQVLQMPVDHRQLSKNSLAS